jgi:deoxyribodipyrimidine photo-lyase
LIWPGELLLPWPAMATNVMVFTRDLRVRDNPALAAACAPGDQVVPLFVLDDRLRGAMRPNRLAFLADSLRDLDGSLRERAGRLVLRRGPWAETIMRLAIDLGAGTIHVSDDVSAFAQRRLSALAQSTSTQRIGLVRHPGVTVVPAGAINPSGGGEFKVFTPYHRRWLEQPWRPLVPPPAQLDVPGSIDDENGSVLDQLADGARGRARDVIAGGEGEGLRRMKAWTADHLATYADRHDDLPGDATSRQSAFLHFGCLSPTEVATLLRDRPGGGPFVRRLCWRDFYHQVLAARADASTVDYRARGDDWNKDDDEFEAWRTGRTGYPLVDAAMRQLHDEGFMHNRARMVVASFLTKDLYQDWRRGARHFMDTLVDADVANNQLNWQWTAGTGTDTNPNRIFNPVRQGERFDPNGDYIRRYVPELAAAKLDAADIHWPDRDTRQRIGYPQPIVDHYAAIAAYKATLARLRTRVTHGST